MVVCAAVVVGAAAVLLVWSVASTREQRSSYSVGGALNGLSLDVGDADVVVEGAGRRGLIEVEHVDRYGFGHPVRATRSTGGGVFSIRSRCPRTILHGCSVSYRLRVPDNVPIAVRTGDGSVELEGYRGSARIATGSGDIDVRGFCGFALQARADDGGDVSAMTDCPPQQLRLRTTSGAVHASVPAGRYQLDASTSGGSPSVSGVSAVADAPFAIQAVSGSGAVVVEGRR
ncbi:MAG TPA: DUF4097 family beta strand repeat-containing protein [Baekduia sp.]|nr:DUF4097 family beta strand repeat-containing protein [Baekduia sp.]